MKIIEPTVELAQDLNAAEIMKHIERAGRVCYKSESNISDTSAEKFIANIIKSGHESVIEHVSITFKIICDRGVTHEIVRHRLASYCVSGDTVIPSYSKNKKVSGKKRTIEDIYNWSQNPKCHAALKSLIIRSFDEQTHTIKPNKIKRVFYNGIKEVFQLTTESGRIIKCTPEHRFFTDEGWKPLKDISVNDFIYSNGIPLLENEDWIRHNYLTLNKTRAQVAQEIGCCEATLYKAFKKFGIVKSWSTMPNRRLGHGVKGMFNEEQRQSIKERMMGENNPSYKHNREDLSASGAYIEAHRKFSNKKNFCEICNSEDNLEIHHKDKNPKNNSEENIKILCSKCHHLWHHPFAIGAFKDRVVDICYVGEMKTYDLEMEEPYHNYIANGIVVHNSQESSRYCDYSGDKFGGELTFIKPCYWNENDENYLLWRETMEIIEKNYLAMRKAGARPEEARSILPNSLKTEIFMTANLREWRHFLKLRMSKRAHPQMRQIALKIFEILNSNLPVIFSDLKF